MKQETFSFYNEDIYNVSNFIVYNENIEAYYYLNQDDDFNNNNHFIFLSGGKKCGKTYLANIWKQKNNAKFIDYTSLSKLRYEKFVLEISKIIEQYDYYILDDIKKPFDEKKLFFLLNLIIQQHSKILITSDFAFNKIKITLKDLKSRINSGMFLVIKKLSKEIKPMLILKLFADRSTKASGQVLKYLVKTLPNDYEAVYNYIDTMIKTAEDNDEKLTFAFVKNFKLNS